MNHSWLVVAVASLLWCAAAFAVARLLGQLAFTPRQAADSASRFDLERRGLLRHARSTYRYFEPWIDEVAASVRTRHVRRVDQVSQSLASVGQSGTWTADVWLATMQIESFVGAAAVAGAAWLACGPGTALFVAIMVAGGYPLFARRQLNRRAQDRRHRIRRALAGSVELLALMLEVGGNFLDCLRTVVRELGDNPLGVELSRVLEDVDRGRPRRQALLEFADRIGDSETRDFAFAVVQGEELGTPLAAILKTQAVQMRQKRTQWAEKASQQAQVTLVFPAMVIMVACLVIVAAPFVISAVNPGN